LTVEAEVGGAKHAKGSYVVRMDQPYSRLADMLLDKQYYNPNDTPPYDDTGWTLTALRNLKSVRVKDAGILKAAMAPALDHTGPEGRVEGEGGVYLVNHNADRALATFRYRLADVKMQAAEAVFEAGGKKFSAGSFVIREAGNGTGLKQKLQAAAADCGVTVSAVKEAPKVAMHELAAPRIALVHTWTSTQVEGWFRLALEGTKIPYAYVSDKVLRETADLRAKYDVIILGPVSSDSKRLVNGIPMRGEPVAWKATELTPNFGTAPDQTDDVRGGIGLAGLMNVQKFVEGGGLFVTIGNNASLPIDFGLIDGVSIQAARELKVRGSVLQAVAGDANSPVMYGYGEKVPVYFNASPILDVNLTGGMSRGGAAGQGSGVPSRASGRGGLNDPDVVQGRVNPPAPPPVRPGEMSAEMMEYMRPYLPPPAERARTVLKFGEEKELLVSGMLAGGRELAGKPAVVDVPKGKGHYLLFAINPMWRQQTQGSHMLLLNAAMNYSSLGVGRPAEAAKPGVKADDDDWQQ
jgi:hypothetical protein